MNEFDNRVIEKCAIKRGKDMFDAPEIFVKYAGEQDFVSLFEYYPDEISFRESELIGLTAAEARTLKFERDKRYLQS
ncbi:MAG: hypothetical protein D4S01_07435 [Dehalococcoidia bacterium]|nr:MAG: hypothetical protein D4S01_07435 [Dehalococcoidia bacterium]